MCVPVPPVIARTVHRFALDSDRQLRRLTNATAGLNGQLVTSGAERIVAMLERQAEQDAHPREMVLELTARRASRPIFSPVTHLKLDRGDMSIERVREVLKELEGIDDLRLTLGGVGDPLMHPQFAEILKLIGEAGIPAVHVETDLLELSDEALAAMGAAKVDVLTVHLPAAGAAMYARVMGVEGYGKVLENLKRVLSARRALPLVVPTFTKCRENLAEMEAWYDHWLRVLGTAVIVGPSDYAGQIPDHAAADMSPPRRRPCARLGSRMTVHSDGEIPSCEEDVLSKQSMGDVGEGVLKSWSGRLAQLRNEHASNRLESRPLCMACRAWHRP
jgi:spiro-SPASM protein